MIADKEMSLKKTLSMLIEEAGQNEGYIEYKGVSIFCDSIRGQLEIGDMQNGRILSVGLSNNMNLKFNRNNMDELITIWDLFSPKDRYNIMEAIAIDNMVIANEKEIDDTITGIVKQKNENVSA